MAGHSHFENIRHKKAARDAKKAKLFTKVQRQVVVALKSGLPDPNLNAKLANALAEARYYGLPKERIDAMLKKYQGGGIDGENYEEIRYNGYANGGISIIVECLSDNKNRSAGEVRAAFTKHGGVLGETGSVEFNFEKIGLITYSKSVANFDQMMEFVIEADGNDLEEDEENFYVTTSFANLHKVQSFLKTKIGEYKNMESIWDPISTNEIDDEKKEKFEKLIDTLEDLDDVQNVYHNAKF